MLILGEVLDHSDSDVVRKISSTTSRSSKASDRPRNKEKRYSILLFSSPKTLSFWNYKSYQDLFERAPLSQVQMALQLYRCAYCTSNFALQYSVNVRLHTECRVFFSEEQNAHI